MLKISLYEFILRGIPEEFLFVLCVHAFSKTAINIKKYLLSGTLLWILAYLIRLLPIQYGIHTILCIITVIVLTTFINNIDIIKSIRATIIAFILEFLFEGINLFILQFILKMNLNIVFKNSVFATVYGLPSIILYGIFVVAYYIKLSKGKELKYI